MELKEALAKAEAQSWPAATEELAYLQGLADAEPEPRLPVQNPFDVGLESDKVVLSSKYVDTRPELAALGGDAVISTPRGGLLRRNRINPGAWTSDREGEVQIDAADVPLPARVIYRGVQ